MTIIDLPRRPTAAKIEWKLRQPTQVNRSEFTGARRATILAVAPRWSATVEYPTISGERAAQPWRAALALLQGRANAFRLVACEGPQLRIGCTIVVDGAGQTGTSVATRGWPSGSRLRAGMFVTIGDRLHQVTAGTAQAGADGKLAISVLPQLAAGLADGAAIEANLPYAVMAMADDAPGWTVDRGQQYAIQFACEEAF